MPKQIKLTDRVAEKLAQRAKEDNLSLAGEVDKLLSVDVRPAEYSDNFVFGKLEYLETYIDKKFDELKSLIEDTTVDRVAGPIKSAAPGTVKVYVPWEVARELFFEFLPDDAPEYIGSASDVIHQADDEFPVYIQDDKLWTEDFYGTKSPILNTSPRVKQFLESHK